MGSLFDQLVSAYYDGTLVVPERAPRVAGEEAQIRDAILGLAHSTHADMQAIEEPIWSAIKQYGGKIVADMVQRDGKWRRAGEMDDLPKRLLKRPDHLDPNKTRIDGNLDEIADAAGMSAQDLKDFLAQNPRRATFAEAMRRAKASGIARKGVTPWKLRRR